MKILYVLSTIILFVTKVRCAYMVWLHHVPLALHSGHEADHSPPSSAEVKEWVELYLHSPNTPSWRGAHLGGAQGQLYLLLQGVAIGESVPKSFRTGRLKRELQMVQLPATRCSCIAIL
jgi:hypothetical protein